MPADQPQNQRVTLAVRAAYPEEGGYDWTESLRPLVEIGAVEVAFHKTRLFLERVEIHDVIAPFSKLRLRITSIHMPHAKITEHETFVEALEKTVRIAQALNCSVIVVHPSYGPLQRQPHEINAFFTQRIDPLLEAINATLCWETFASKRRFLSGIEGIAAFCQGRQFHGACYNTSHLYKTQKRDHC
ncbi:MAG: TIM barrel protein [Candidatus Hadarchaeum sp.]